MRKNSQQRIGRPVSDHTGVDLVAHTPSDVHPEVWHSLGSHLREVGNLAGSFAAPFGGTELARLAGFLHDAGKATDEVQEAFRHCHLTKQRRLGVPHKEDGAGILFATGTGEPAMVGAMAIMGHHGGLPDLTEAKELRRTIQADPGATRSLLDKIAHEIEQDLAGLLSSTIVPDRITNISDRNDRLLDLELFIRMCFSCLVDADFIDTAAHFTGKAPVAAPALGMDELLRRFRVGHSDLVGSRAPGPATPFRNALFGAACEAAKDGPQGGIYRMPAPTGSGKTASAAAFALEHAVIHNKSRVIMAVPFTSITTQNAQVYRRLLQDNDGQIVLEHHSAIEDAAIDEDERRRLSAQNWDSEFIVTTTVQLFESLFSRKPAAMRKLHRLTNSVIVLDEVQALPLHWAPSILRLLRQLTKDYGVTVLLASATQPAFWQLAIWEDVECTDIRAQDILLPHRVDFDVRAEDVTWQEIADEVAQLRQCLVIVNTTADAQHLHELVAQQATAPGSVLHLSTRMCPAHRSAVLAETATRLAAGEAITLISTQVVEAGVDFDFPVVFRAMAPAEAIKQAAGRCNREGVLASAGRVVVFEPQEGGRPQGLYTAATQLTKDLLRECDRPFSDTFMDTYYAELFDDHLSEGNGSRSKKLDAARAGLNFRTTHDLFAMIDDTSLPVLVDSWGETDPADTRALREILHRLDSEPETPLDRRDLRILARHTVQVPIGWRTTADVVDVGGVPRWIGTYDDSVGVRPSSDTDSAIIW